MDAVDDTDLPLPRQGAVDIMDRVKLTDKRRTERKYLMRQANLRDDMLQDDMLQAEQQSDKRTVLQAKIPDHMRQAERHIKGPFKRSISDGRMMAFQLAKVQYVLQHEDCCGASCAVCDEKCTSFGGLKIDAAPQLKANNAAKKKTVKKKKAKMAVNKKIEPKLAIGKNTELELMVGPDWYEDDRNRSLLDPKLTWEQKVVKILHMARCREFTEYNHKLGISLPTRFCAFNIAFFDLDKESEGLPWIPIHKIPSPRRLWLADSVNVVAIKVAESDRDYPISVFGTVLARDEYDYRCVYLFKRGRDDPQVITSKDDGLTLMGPYRALAVSDSMYFEFHLKIKGDGDVDEDFSKGCLEHSAVRHSQQPTTMSLCSCLSTVELVYTPVPFAVEASFAVSILKGPSDIIDKVTAWTTRNEENKIVLYNKKVASIGGTGSVHGLVAVPDDEELVLRVCVFEHCEHELGKCFQLVLRHGIEDCFVGQEPYELQVKICWRGVVNRRGPGAWGRPNMWQHLGSDELLL